MVRKSILFVLLSALVAGFAACGGATDANPVAPGSNGTMNIRITDGPFGSAKAVLVTFSEVSLLRGNTWTRVPFPDGNTSSWMCDLKKLENNAEDLLATGAIPHTEYTWVRFMVQSATLHWDNSASSPTPCARTIAAPAGGASPMTIANPEGKQNGSFSVSSDRPTTILLDFDGASSVSQQGSAYILDPVVRIRSIY